MGDSNNVNIDKAIRTLYAPPRKDATEAQRDREKPPTKHGGFEAVFLKRKEDEAKEAERKLEAAAEELRGLPLGATLSPETTADVASCIRRRNCSKAADLDIADLESKAFRFMVL